MVTDNIDWKSIYISSSSNETHQISCILIQRKENDLDANHDSALMNNPATLHGYQTFNREAHRSFKGNATMLPEETVRTGK